jgi:hypothetical protein
MWHFVLCEERDNVLTTVPRALAPRLGYFIIKVCLHNQKFSFRAMSGDAAQPN